MKILQKMPIDFVVHPGDILTLHWTPINGVKIDVLSQEIDHSFNANEAIIFEVEPGDFDGAKEGIGGAFIRR